ncbi:MAG: hypothetical protein ACI87F_000553, partial [Candidatus Azotimanducaceae bacterium]
KSKNQCDKTANTIKIAILFLFTAFVKEGNLNAK